MLQQFSANAPERSRDAAPAAAALWLLCRVGTLTCALPVAQVGAVMRLLPIEPVAGMPPYLRGVALIRGAPVPVVDTGLVIGSTATAAQRLVMIKAEERTVALAVDEVIGVMPLAAEAVDELPPLLLGAAAGVVAGISATDGRLLVFLRASRIVPADVLGRLDTKRTCQ